MTARPQAPITTGQTFGDPETAPQSVRTLRVLGHGRAAQAELVESVMADGSRTICVEKVFAAGWLTRTIYRISFQAPFAYQTNRDAVLACFYRRRVAAKMLEASDTGIRVASPLYVRFDRRRNAWVLAAEWIQGRGIRPAPADRTGMRRLLRRSAPRVDGTAESVHEIDELVASMHTLEALFATCGLYGSGWQVAPRALVSTANLLREGGRHTIIDLESGIPAVLVPKYLIAGARCGAVPPFDDLDANKLRDWVDANDRLLLFRLGNDGLSQLRDDVEKLIEYSSRWKSSELALLRRPWRLLRRGGMTGYRQECFRRWEQDGTVDADTASTLPSKPFRSRMIWWAGLIPAIGKGASRLVGNRDDRRRLIRCARDRNYRDEQLNRWIGARESKWMEEQRLSTGARLTLWTYLLHRVLSALTPKGVHRFLSDHRVRRDRLRQTKLLLLSSRYQAWFGNARIESSIESWRLAERMTSQEAESLRRQLSGSEVRAYVRGLGVHLALKTTAPIVLPAKYGGLAAFVATGNLWFLLPMLLMPAARTAATLVSWWSTRSERIPHAEALFVGMLPVVGSAAFPLQMFAARSELSIFLIRDAASKLGRRIPIYGGPNSRTEIALIRYSDVVIELLDIVSAFSHRVYRPQRSAPHHGGEPILKVPSRTRWGGRLDQQAIEEIAQQVRRRADRREQLNDSSPNRHNTDRHNTDRHNTDRHNTDRHRSNQRFPGERSAA